MNRALLYLALRIGNLWGEDHQIDPDISKITTAQAGIRPGWISNCRFRILKSGLRIEN
jgi:hypothetical protein